MRKTFLPPSDPLLTQNAKEVMISEFQSNALEEDISSMFEVAYGEQKNRKKPLMVGLAAPQIGISKRIILVDVAADGKGKVGDLRLYINPEIIMKSREVTQWYEGCYSTGRVCGIVSRSVEIRIKAIDVKGNDIEEDFLGYTARIFQHEVDHLDGKVFVDHIRDDSKLHWVEEDEFPRYRDQEAWRTWSRRYSRNKWESLRKGSR